MTTRAIYECNGCGKAIDQATASQFAGIWQGQSAVAAQDHAWHSCSATCAAAHLHKVADAIVKRGAELEKK